MLIFNRKREIYSSNSNNFEDIEKQINKNRAELIYIFFMGTILVE